MLSLGLVPALGGLAGCETSDADHGGTAYPLDRAQTATLDIQVVRDETTITLTNATARAFPATRMWINQWYSREIPGLGVGETLRLELSEFKDEYGQEFRAGGFWATRKPERLVLAQLEAEEGMLGLVVVDRGAE